MKREIRHFAQVDITKGVYLPWAVIVKKEGADLRSVKRRFGCVSRLRFAFGGLRFESCALRFDSAAHADLAFWALAF